MDNTPSKSKAALWMGGWLTLMLTVAITGREAMQQLNVFQVMEIRSVIGIIVLYPVIHFNGGLAAMKTSRLPLYIGRNAVHYIGQAAWFLALAWIPLSQVVSIEFTMPIWTAILAVCFLGERMTIWKIAAILLGVVGVVVIVRPSAGAVNPGQLVALTAAVGFGIALVMLKLLTRTEGPWAIIFWMAVIQSAIGFFPSLYAWVWPSAYIWACLLVIACAGIFSHYCMARALLHADATVVVPMDFLRVPLTATAGWLIYSERVDLFTVLGAALVLTGNLLNLKGSSPMAREAGAEAGPG
jgi:drug/metabolite transporter (DMT)-like permease